MFETSSEERKANDDINTFDVLTENMVNMDTGNSGLDQLNTNGDEVSSEENYFVAQMTSDGFVDDKELTKFIKDVEKLVRISYEYKQYISYLKQDLNINTCSYLPFLGGQDEKGRDITKIEIHHLIRLYDICNIVINYKLENGEKINTFMIAEEVIKAHYENIVPVIPVSTSVHQAIHGGLIIESFYGSFGSVKKFIEKYKDGLENIHVEKINELINNTKNIEEIKKFNSTKLESTSVPTLAEYNNLLPSVNNQLGIEE